MPTAIEVFRAASLEQLMKLEIQELGRLTELCNTAFAKRRQKEVEQLIQQQTDIHQLKQSLLQFRPLIEETFATKPVKLNVGGMYFSTTLINLLREERTFFAAMFGGNWEVKCNPDDKAVFIDRDPTMFQVILNYMRSSKFDLADFDERQLAKLRDEADFYQISSLIHLLNPPAFSFTKNMVKLSYGNNIATNEQIGGTSLVFSSAPFSPTCTEMKVKVINGQYLFIGIASHDTSPTAKDGFYVYCQNGTLYSPSGNGTAYKTQAINAGSTVTVKLDEEFNVSFAVDGEDWGIAYTKIASDHSKPLHLAVLFSFANASILCPGQVQLLE